MTQGHTEGPWRVRMTPRPIDGGFWREIVSADGLVIGEIYSDGNDVTEPSEAAATANANLIASTPELLNALRAAECGIEQLCQGQDHANQCWVTLAEIHAAIAKAGDAS